MKQKILFSITAFILNACNQEQPSADPAQTQIEEYTQELKDCNKEPDNKTYVRDLSVAPDDMVLGNPESKIVLVEYFSPTCPHCVHYHQKIFPEIRTKYLNTNT